MADVLIKVDFSGPNSKKVFRSLDTTIDAVNNAIREAMQNNTMFVIGDKGFNPKNVDSYKLVLRES